MEIVERLIKNLFAAIDNHNLKKVKVYVKKAREINKKNEIINGEIDGIKPIHRAVYAYNFRALRFLLHNGADINAISSVCINPFAYVTTAISPTMNNEIEEIVNTNIAHDHCNSTSPQEMQGFTALHLALFYCRLDIARILIRNKNIDINIKNMNNETAFDVIGGYYNFSHGSYTIKEVLSITANNVTEADCKTKLTSMKAGIKVGLKVSNTKDLASSTVNSSSTLTRGNFEEVSSTASNAVKPSSFINGIFSWITTAAISYSTPALPTVQHPVAHPTGSSIDFSQDYCYGIAMLAIVAINKCFGIQFSRLMDNSPLTLKELQERKVSVIERDIKMALSKFKKCYQYPESSLSDSTISRFASSKSL